MDKVRASHILVQDLSTAQAIRKQLDEGKNFADAAKEAKDRLRKEFAAALEAVGADAAKAILEGEEIAKVSLVQPRTTAEVLSEKAFVEWVRQKYEYEIIETVRESFRKHVLESVENVDYMYYFFTYQYY
mgnify:CR=1 FL=1